ncbi:MAG: hypothetical protein LBR74_04355 [Eubacterium sp.]|jgi:hypothetical protein|nr:hypothetical protein [Eubacterium sp.]
MVTVRQLEKLKKISISVDIEKSRLRIPEAFKSATKIQKDEIKALTGFSSNTFYNISKSGAATPKVVISLAQILNISPYYLTGESDDIKPIGDEGLNQFLKKCNAKNKKNIKTKSGIAKPKTIKIKTTNAEKIKPIKKSKMKTEKQEQKLSGLRSGSAFFKNVSPESVNAVNPVKRNEPATPKVDESTTKFTVSLDNSKKMNKAVSELNEETAVVLLRALMFRAKTGGKSEELCDIVKRCLLS